MICPECKTEFRGKQFYPSNKQGAYRRCPNGHDFKEPEKPRRETKEQRAIKRLEKWCNEVFSEGYHPEFKNGLASAWRVINDSA